MIVFAFKYKENKEDLYEERRWWVEEIKEESGDEVEGEEDWRVMRQGKRF